MKMVLATLLGMGGLIAMCGCSCVPSETLPRPKGDVLLDVRTPEEFASGHLQGALNLPYDQITADVVTQIPDKTATIQVYCRSGRRSAIAVETLKTLGYTDLQDLGGFSDAQVVLNLPIEP